MQKKSLLIVGLTVFLAGLTLAAAVAGITLGQTSQGEAAEEWVELFNDTFTTTLPVWAISDTVDGMYQWGIVSYTRTLGTVVVVDHGLWAAGGGTVGETQSWPTSTYTNAMQTWAIAGPFTLTEKFWELRLSLSVQNRLAEGDALFVGLSNDGEHFDGVTLTHESQTMLVDWMAWSTESFSNSEAVWIGLFFESDEALVAAGPLVDDVRLEANAGYDVYLPAILHMPTPTPTPTPTPLPIYTDDFEDPDSGWHVGTAWRYNSAPDHQEWEAVAYLDYFEGYYRNYIPLTAHGGGDVDTWFVWPAEFAPLPEEMLPIRENYCLEVRGSFASSRGDYDPWWGHWGLIFGGDETETDFYTFQINANSRWAVLHYDNYVYPGNRQPLSGEPVNEEIAIIRWDDHGEYGDIIHRQRKFNALKVVVKGDWMDFYVNGIKMGSTRIVNMPKKRIGVIGGSWEVTPVEIWWDDFRYDPFCPEVQ